MTIDEAIEIKERYHAMIQRLGVPRLYEADKLSIEALKRYRAHKVLLADFKFDLLPGETKD